MASEEATEERVESHEIDEAATGRRWRLSLAMIGLGIAGAAAGALFDIPALIYGGATVVVVFGLVAAGSTVVGFASSKGATLGARLPRRFKRRTSLRKSGLPVRPAEGSEGQDTGQNPS